MDPDKNGEAAAGCETDGGFLRTAPKGKERERFCFAHQRYDPPSTWQAWFHFHTWRRRRPCIGLEVAWLRGFCGLEARVGEDGWTWFAAFPGLAVWLSFECFPYWGPTYQTTATWRDPVETITLPESRECGIRVSDWTLCVTPWGKSDEWCVADPWWVRGLSFDVKRFVLGRQTYEKHTIELRPVVVPMPEYAYPAQAKIERVTRGRQRWFKRTRTEVWLDIPKGIPHAGKGENSWDCGDDGLYGIGGSSVEDAIGRAVASVLKNRARYGNASAAGMAQARA